MRPFVAIFGRRGAYYRVSIQKPVPCTVSHKQTISMKILASEQLYQADKATVEKQKISSWELMERAGTQVFNWLHQILNEAPVPVRIFCGIGNNGGDGLVLGRLLLAKGYTVSLYVVNYSDKRSEDFGKNYEKYIHHAKVPPKTISSEADFPVINAGDIVVDAIFGIGLNRPPEGWVKKLIRHLNHSEALRLAIDVPSGLYPNKPLEDREAVYKAKFVLTFQLPKLTFFLPDSAPFISGYKILDIGLDADFIDHAEPLATFITRPQAKQYYIPREKFGHKGTYGHSLIIAGSYGKIGAAILATTAALKTGAGMVTAFVPKCGYQIMQISVPEAMVLTDDKENHLSAISFGFEPSAMAIGMGIGKAKETLEAFKEFLRKVEKPLVIDADGLNLISENSGLLQYIPKNSILTPHPGELKRLIGEWENDFDKLEKTKSFSKEHQVIVVIKGAYTMTVHEDSLFVNSTGNPGMGTAGSGDALSGVITGLLSQGYKPLEAAIFGVYLHGSAGDIAACQNGPEALTARDIIDNLSQAYIELDYDENQKEIYPQKESRENPN